MSKTNTNNQTVATATVAYQTNEDFKNALLIVSVFLNLFVLTTWLVAQSSTTYAAQLMSLL